MAPDFELAGARPQAPMPVAPFYEWTFPNGSLWTAFYRTGAGYLLRFPGLADFEVSADGREIICHPAPDIRDATPEHLYWNQVLPLVLNRLGKFSYHASAIETAQGAVAFLGESGRGKSTLAAHFAANGHRILTDDGLLLEQCDKGFRVLPGHPSIRLWEDSEKTLASMNVEAAEPLHFTTKTRFLAGTALAYCDEPLPLKAAYFLGDGSAREICFRRLGTAETLMGWVKNSFLLDVEDRSEIAGHFARVGKLANTIVCHELDYPRRFDDLDRLRNAILDHLSSEGRAA